VFQTSGQVLPLAEARKSVEASSPGHSEEARQILADLCERGLLATDGQNLRFWHQTIQEYFYAGSVVRRWRESKKQVGRMPWWLRRLAAKAEEEEALSFMVAHLSEEEAESALRRGLRVNPALAISWADDLSLEGRAVPATESFPARFRRFALAARRYSRWGLDSRASILMYMGCLGPFLGLMIAALLASLVFRNFDAEFTSFYFPACGLLLGLLPVLDVLLYCPSVRELESALGAIPEIRDPSLRKALSASAQEISHSRLARQDIRVLARAISVMEHINGEELIRLLRTSDEPYATTRLIGHLDTRFAIPLLEELSKLNNFLSLAALEALALRANRFRHERTRIKELLWRVWGAHELDGLIRRRARQFLLRAGEHPGGRGYLLRYFVLRFLKALAVMIGLYTVFDRPPLAVAFLCLLGVSTLVWWDARRIGARSIRGLGLPRYASGEPWLWATGSLLLAHVLVPLYVLNRQRIRRDAAPVDWDAILQAIQAKEPHGDSLSITHPPSLSAPSPRR
jgi:hypothetical protein